MDFEVVQVSEDKHRLARIEACLLVVAEQLRLLRVPMPPRLLSVSEVCEILGLSPKSVQRAVRVGELRAAVFECGRRRIYRVQATDLQTFIDERKRGRASPVVDRSRPKTIRVPE